MSLHLVNEPPTVQRFQGAGGSAWLVACPTTREAIVIDEHLAKDAVAERLAEAGLRLVARLGTESCPEKPALPPVYLKLLADLGLDQTPANDKVLTAGPVAGWTNAIVVRVNDHVVELAEDAAGSFVMQSDKVTTDSFQVEVTSVVLKFGRMTAIGEARAEAPDGQLSWRIGRHLFVSRFSGASASGTVNLHETQPPRMWPLEPLPQAALGQIKALVEETFFHGDAWVDDDVQTIGDVRVMKA